MDQEGLLQGETPVWGWTKTKYHVWGDLLMLGGGGWLLWVWMGHDGELGIAHTCCMHISTCVRSGQACVFCAEGANACGVLWVCSAPQPGAVCSIVHDHCCPLGVRRAPQTHCQVHHDP